MTLRSPLPLVLLGVIALGCAPSAQTPDPQVRAGSVATTRARVPLPKAPIPLPGPERVADDYRLVVKFSDGATIRGAGEGRVRSVRGASLAQLDAVVRRTGLRFTPLFDAPEASLRAFEERARALSGRDQPDLSGLYQVELPGAAPGQLHEVGTALQRLDVVEFASLQMLGAPPPADIDPPTPDLRERQDFRGPPPGMNFDAAIALGYDGSGIHLSDIEYAWSLTHEELNDVEFHPEPGVAIGSAFADHGTAVLGLLTADVADYGIDGLSPGAEIYLYPQYTAAGADRSETAVINALVGSEAGDVVLFEMQTEGKVGAGGPKELDEVFWMLTRMATDAGIVIVAAAGNGTIDLDAPTLQDYRARGDSGAIIVGAGTPGTMTAESFSTYGARVDVQGWGSQVFTAGYGTFAAYGGDPNQTYVDDFGGTSSASALVAAAAVLTLNAFAEHDVELGPEQLRKLLIATGVPQGPGGHIGPLVNVAAAVDGALDGQEPEVAIIDPPEDLVVDASSHVLDLEMEATDDTAIYAVGLQINGKTLPQTDLEAPYGFMEVALPVGAWEVVALAEDAVGKVTASAPRMIYVGVDPPAGSSGGSSEGSTEHSSGESAEGSTAAAGDSASDDDDDAGTDTDAPSGSGDGSGCSSAPGPTPALGWWMLFVAVLVWSSRRREASTS